MKDRCYNERAKQYKYYGEKGVIVCDRWLENFDNFLCDMGQAPKGFSLSRNEDKGNYEPWKRLMEATIRKLFRSFQRRQER